MEAETLKLILDHGVCVVVLVVIYFWRIEPLLSKLVDANTLFVERLRILVDDERYTK